MGVQNYTAYYYWAGARYQRLDISSSGYQIELTSGSLSIYGKYLRALLDYDGDVTLVGRKRYPVRRVGGITDSSVPSPDTSKSGCVSRLVHSQYTVMAHSQYRVHSQFSVMCPDKGVRCSV